MKVIAQVKLLSGEDNLRETMIRCNQAANWLSHEAWESKTFKKYDLHKLCYYELRARFSLPSQMAVRCIAKVADAYKLDTKVERQFRELGAIAFDDRNLSWRNGVVSISSLPRRLTLSYVCGNHQTNRLKDRRGESKLIYRDGCFYLHTTCLVDEPVVIEPTNVIGVDLGIVNIATTSERDRFSGAKINSLRKRHRRLRAKLQSKGTKSAKRLLRKRRKKEQRFAKDVNHCISKKLVLHAKGTNSALALEDLTGIRQSVRLRKAQRAVHASWSFYQLRQFIEYKSKMHGVPVYIVDPRYTSQEYGRCGHIERANRPNQYTFCCKACGFSDHADFNAAGIVKRRAIFASYLCRAAVNQPNAPALCGCASLTALA